MLDNWIDKRLSKQGFMRVPTSWSADYQNLVEKKAAVDKAIREIGREYNALLKEFAEEKSQAWLKEQLTELKIDTKGANKEQLINLYVEAYAVNFEDDLDEEVK